MSSVMSSVMEHSAASHHWVTEAADLAAKEQGRAICSASC